MDRSCKDNHGIMTWVGLIFVFMSNSLSPDSLQMFKVVYLSRHLATAVPTSPA